MKTRKKRDSKKEEKGESQQSWRPSFWILLSFTLWSPNEERILKVTNKYGIRFQNENKEEKTSDHQNENEIKRNPSIEN